MNIGKNIAKYRKAAGLTQEELGGKLGVTNQAVSKWESGVSMPDILLLPEIAAVLGITLEDIYGIKKEDSKPSVSADDFPSFCHKALFELFYSSTKMRFTHIGSSDNEQLAFLLRKIMNGCRIGCISNTQGAVVMTEDFAFVDRCYKTDEHADLVRMKQESETVLTALSDRNVRKVLFFQYALAMENSREHNAEYTLEDVMYACNLTEDETCAALRSLREIRLNEVYTEPGTKTKKYVFLYSNAVYALAIYKLAELMSEDPVWAVVRDTSMISDYAF